MGRKERADTTQRPATWLHASLIVVFFAAVLLALSGPIRSNDYGFHLRIGEEIVANATLPFRDYHSHTAPGAEYPDHEWLSQVVYYAVYAIVGDAGMVAVRALLISIALAIVFITVRGPFVLRFACICTVFLLGVEHDTMRPHLLGWILAAIFVWLLERDKRRLVALHLVVWANFHGSVMLGALIGALFFFEKFWESRDRRELAWAAGCVILPLLNPHHFGIYTVALRIAPYSDFVGEWLPYGPSQPAFWLVVAVVGVSLAGWVQSSPRKPFDLVKIVLLSAFAFRSSRNGVVAAIYLAPLLGRFYSARIEQVWPQLRSGLGVGIVIAAIAVAGVRVRQGRVLRFELDDMVLPIGAVEFIVKHELNGPMFNDYNFGGYLIWKAPQHPVFIDGRNEVYAGKVYDDNLAITDAKPGWERLVADWNVDYFVTHPFRPISAQLNFHPSWDLVYFDHTAVIFVRADLYPHVRRMRYVSPFDDRAAKNPLKGIDELDSLLAATPRFFSGYLMRAMLQYRAGDFRGAVESVESYFDTRPKNTDDSMVNPLIEDLRQRGAW